MADALPQFLGGKNAPFGTYIKELVAKDFERTKTNIHGNFEMYVKTFILLSLFFSFYYLIFFICPQPMGPWYIQAIIYVLYVIEGAIIAGIGFCVMHDAIHRSYSSNQRVNMILGLTLNMEGGINFIWKIQHNLEHHPYTNIAGLDHDIDVPILLRLSPRQNWYIWHRAQWLYVFGIYAIYYFLWIFILDPIKYVTICIKDWRKWRKNEKNRNKKITLQFVGHYIVFGFNWGHLLNFCISKFLFVAVWVLIPKHILGFYPWKVWATVGGTCSLIISLVFQLAHTVEGAEFPEPVNGKMETENVIHQARTTFNFSPKSWFARVYLGGLNYQLEHHIFFQYCHVHYRRISKLIKPAFERFNVPYNCNPTFLGAVGSHIRFLYKNGNPKGISWNKLFVRFKS